MKLTMKNNYTFQKVSGYPDDPKMMSTDEVKEELARWAHVIGSWMEGDAVDLCQVVGLDAFLSALATSEVEYEEHLESYRYHAGYEYFNFFDVVAGSQEEADKAANEQFRRMRSNMPRRVNESRGVFGYLERNDGSGYLVVGSRNDYADEEER